MEVEGGKQQDAVNRRYLRAFEEESPGAYQIALDKPDYWEFLLTRELLRDKLAEVRREYRDLHDGLIYRPAIVLKDKWEAKDYLLKKIGDINAIMNMLTKASSVELKRALGEPGEPGDPLAILRATQRIADAHRALLDWEVDLVFTQFPRRYEEIKEMMIGFTKDYLQETERIESEISRRFSAELRPEGALYINLEYDAPPHVDQWAPRFRELWDSDLDGLR